jgi:hypothetical protein
MIQASLDVGFHHESVPPELPRDRARTDRIERANLGTVPVAASQEILLIDGFEYARNRELHQLIFDGRYPQRAPPALPLRDIVASNPFRAGGLPRQSVDAVSNVFLEGLRVVLGAAPVHAVRGVFVDVAPAVVPQFLIAQLIEVANPRLLVAGCVVCYAPP